MLIAQPGHIFGLALALYLWVKWFKELWCIKRLSFTVNARGQSDLRTEETLHVWWMGETGINPMDDRAHNLHFEPTIKDTASAMTSSSYTNVQKFNILESPQWSERLFLMFWNYWDMAQILCERSLVNLDLWYNRLCFVFQIKHSPSGPQLRNF